MILASGSGFASFSVASDGFNMSYESGPKGMPERRRPPSLLSGGGGAGLTDLRLMVWLGFGGGIGDTDLALTSCLSCDGALEYVTMALSYE